MKERLLIHSAKQIVQVVSNGEKRLTGEDMKHLAILNASEGSGCSLIVNSHGKIEFIGHDEDLQEAKCHWEFEEMIDATDMCVIPGFVDAHTHPVWAGDRVHEFAMKLAGATYLDVHKSGGGINFTVNHTRQATEEELYESFQERLGNMLKTGSTTVECKTGYGLDKDTEIKMLKVLKRGRRELSNDISITYLGAHSVPQGMTADQAVDDIIDNQLPEIQKLIVSGEIDVDNIDVFCEQGVFDVAQSRRILEAGRQMNLKLNFHGEELHQIGGAEMGASLKAEAISHLEEISQEGMAAMAASGTVAVILPTTAYILRLKPPPVRDMIGMNIPVALGSDFNPNAYCMSMPTVMNLACITCNMTMPEALAAATINAAASLGRADDVGSLEVGKFGDLIVLDAPRWEHVIYRMSDDSNLIKCVVKKGSVVYKRH